MRRIQIVTMAARDDTKLFLSVIQYNIIVWPSVNDCLDINRSLCLYSLHIFRSIIVKFMYGPQFKSLFASMAVQIAEPIFFCSVNS